MPDQPEPFNEQTWKDRIRQRLQGWSKPAANTLYGFLATMSLFPVVEAWQRGQYEAFVTLGSVTGGIGAGLITNLVQEWAHGGETQDEVISELEALAKQDEEMREALDAIMTKLEVMQMAEAGLHDEDKAWFVQTLREELQKLGNWDKYEAVLIGKGSIAQNHSAAATDFAIAINGNVANSIIAIYAKQVSRAATEADYTVALERYVRHLLTTRHVLNLRGIRSYQPISIELEQAYVTLRALDPQRTENMLLSYRGRARTEALQKLLEKERAEPQPLQELLQKHDRLVVLGDPGSGKTTFLSYLTLSIARAIAEDNPSLLEERLGIREVVPVPIILPLREFGRYLRNLPENERLGPRPQLLLDYLNTYYEGWNLDLPQDFFTHHLEQGRCLVMLDGLDEVADFTERVLVSEQIEAFVQRYGDRGNRFVITCRVRGYEGQARLVQRFITTTILSFTDADIQRFAHAWSLAVEASQARSDSESIRKQAADNARDLLRAIQANPKIRELAGNPLLLTVIALVHQYRAKLPERRSELYNAATEVLLGYFELGKPGEESKRLARYTGTQQEMDAGEKRAFLEPLALAMHQAQVREWDRDQVTELLANQFHERGYSQRESQKMAKDFLDALVVRSELIQEVELGIYGFLHLSFQEYLTARKIADSDDYIQQTLSHLDDSWWKEVILLEAGHLSESGRSRISKLVQAILEEPGDPFQRLLFAGECLVDVGENRAEASLWRRIMNELLDAMLKDDNPKRRAATGRIVAKLGDPRPGVGLNAQGLPDILWSDPIAPGPFIMGNTKATNPMARDTEAPQFTCNLITVPYRISIYPITVSQYLVFIEAGGYEERQYWTKAGWKWREKNKIFGPREYGEPFTLDNHPQVGVSWYEAVAFCSWLSEITGLAIQLPTEAQWERAARHTDGRRYPWSDDPQADPDPNRMNYSYSLTVIGATSAVGVFPAGQAVCGAQDMSGNVWEWCRTQWRSNYENYEQEVDDSLDSDARRVLRGGSFDLLEFNVRTAVRNWVNPSSRGDIIGFRVVLLLPFPSDPAD